MDVDIGGDFGNLPHEAPMALVQRQKGRGRGRGLDHFRWPNRHIENLGLFSLERAREEPRSLRGGAHCRPEGRVREW